MLKFNIVANGENEEWQIPGILEMAARRPKRNEIWNSGVPVEHVQCICDLTAFKFILESSDTLAIFQKYNFHNAASTFMTCVKQTF